MDALIIICDDRYRCGCYTYNPFVTLYRSMTDSTTFEICRPCTCCTEENKCGLIF